MPAVERKMGRDPSFWANLQDSGKNDAGADVARIWLTRGEKWLLDPFWGP